jgi:hypothetical protein
VSASSDRTGSGDLDELQQVLEAEGYPDASWSEIHLSDLDSLLILELVSWVEACIGRELVLEVFDPELTTIQHVVDFARVDWVGER